MVHLDKGLQWGIFRTLTYSEPEAYSEPRHIHNSGIFRAASIFRTLSHIYNEALTIFTAIVIFTNYNYFCKVCRVEINIWR